MAGIESPRPRDEQNCDESSNHISDEIDYRNYDETMFGMKEGLLAKARQALPFSNSGANLLAVF